MEKYYKILKKPVVTENTFDLIDEQNKIVFYVDIKANKKDIKQAIQTIYDVKVIKINTLITSKGQKKAFIKLHPADSASELAIKLGIF
ncbi:MAG: 50S ribosomal protein L23 [Candidatus Lokiarchaeota archaeon]|nr:50S ribosomal protein L23 [Candidatus Lokiarchaeota archaeon]